MAESRILGIAMLTIVSWLPAYSYQPSANRTDESARGSVETFLKSFDRDLKGRFIVGFADLNDDGKPEAIVHLTSSYRCGSGGCTTLILVRQGDSWRILTEVSVTRAPILVVVTKSHGWRSIGVWVQGGGIQTGYEAELRFDGKTYPENPSMAPAGRLAGASQGEVVIPSPAKRQHPMLRAKSAHPSCGLRMVNHDGACALNNSVQARLPRGGL
jgi:hypothetical protein